MDAPIPRYPRTRISSPGVAAASFAVANNARSGQHRATALLTVNTVSDVINMIEAEYRELLRKKLNAIAEDARRSNVVRASLIKLEQHKAAGTLPPFIQGKKPPTLQLSKEFAALHAAEIHKMDDEHVNWQKGWLTGCIQLKQEEFIDVQSRLAVEKWMGLLVPTVKARFVELKEKCREPVWTGMPGAEDEDAMEADAEPGEVTITEYRESPLLRANYFALLKDLPAIGLRIIMLATAEGDRKDATSSAKKSLKAKADADHPMAPPVGESVVSKSVQDLVAKAVSAAIKKQSNPGGSKKVSNAHKASRNLRYSPYPLSEARRRQDQGRQRVGEYHQAQGAPQEGKRSQGSGPRKDGWEGSEEGWKTPQEVEDWLLTQPIRYDHPSSWPDEILLIDPIRAIRILHTMLPISVLISARYKAFVHIGPGVEITSDSSPLLRELSLSYKYMFPSENNARLLLDAYSDFEDRLRWKLFWTYKIMIGDADEQPFDPDYRVEKVRKTCDHLAYQGIERAIELGRDYVRHCSLNAIPTITEEPLPAKVPRGRIYRWLTENKYLVLPTDKNLGACVVTLDWYQTNCIALLGNVADYVEITNASRLAILEQQRVSIEALGADASNKLGHKQLRTFLTQHIVGMEDGETREQANARIPIPKFYGIPKIHKTPTRFRPIVPCHSALQNPAAKFCSKMLKPLIESSPYILKGSKQLALDLSKLQLQRGRKFWLVTGDVVAFYPNVPVDQGIACVMELFEAHYDERPATPSDRSDLGIAEGPPSEAEGRDYSPCPPGMLSQALNVALTNLILSYGNKTYQQVRGLAMGVACSPDVANLYGHYFEAQQIPDLDRLAFYKRYIDDLIAIVYAETAEEARQYVRSNIVLGDCEIIWEPASIHCPFLDMWLYIDPYDQTVQHTPYRKALNHFERIPWDSAHPVDVKKGTFMGELSRLATLSSKLEHYETAIHDLCCVYISRGYPIPIIRHWSKQYAHKKWEARLSKAIVNEDPVLVVKSEFNSAWNWFNIDILKDTIMKSLGRWKYDFESGKYGNVNSPVHPDRWDEWVELDRLDFVGIADSLGLPRESVTDRLIHTVGEAEPRSAAILNLDSYIMGNARWLVSRKRTQNFADLASLWRQSLLKTCVEQDDFIIPHEN